MRSLPTFVLTTLTVTAMSFGLSAPLALAQKKETSPMKLGEPIAANAFVELNKLVHPAVVSISTTTGTRPNLPQRGNRDPYFDMLEQLFGQRINPPVRPAQALGSGFLIREDGLIVTNNHVIDGADTIQVLLADNPDKPLTAKVVGRDGRTDIALIKIEGKSYPILQLGSSASTEVGEWVAAFGNPFGNSHTMTKGIVSAKGRDIAEINRFPMIQTDAPINPGNSGGPLVNLKGQVIGVNSAIDPRAQGIGFAIPIDEVKTVLPQLEKEGRIRSGYLGVVLADLDPRIAEELGLDNLEGAIIAQVEPRSPADRAGLKAYDVITEFNGKKVGSSNALRTMVADAGVDQKANLKLIRDGKPRTLSVHIGDRPQAPQARQPEAKEYKGSPAPHNFGFDVSEITPPLRKDFDIPPDVRKPLVVKVTAGSPAARGGLLVGDVILDVNRREVTAPADVVKNLKKGTNTLRVYRQGAILFLMLRNE